ncbi:MAG: flagellar export protein FliJ [Spirochaetales bacterium]|nr:flagellar export protein FliJ [Spirochaetales bacterium]
MKRFRFRLEPLLRLRAHREQEWLNKLAEAAGHCVRVNRNLRENSSAASEAFQTDFRKERRVDLSLLMYREQYLARLGIERRRLEEELRERMARKEEVQQKYLEVSRDRKILDKLKERRGQEFYRDQKTEEFKAMDDISSSRYVRARLEQG